MRPWKTISAALVVAFFIVPSAGADDLEPSSLARMAAPLEHSSRVYRDAAQLLYVQAAEDSYLRLSTSDQPDAQSFILYSDNAPEKTNPMHLEGAGLHTIVHPDEHGKKGDEGIVFPIYADGQAPSVEVKLRGAPAKTRRQVTYFGHGLVGTLSSTDDDSGVQQTLVSIDGLPFCSFWAVTRSHAAGEPSSSQTNSSVADARCAVWSTSTRTAPEARLLDASG